MDRLKIKINAVECINLKPTLILEIVYDNFKINTQVWNLDSKEEFDIDKIEKFCSENKINIDYLINKISLFIKKK